MNSRRMCYQVQDQLINLLNGRLPVIVAQGVRRHVRQCPVCHARFLVLASSGMFRAQLALQMESANPAQPVLLSVVMDDSLSVQLRFGGERWLNVAYEPEPYYLERLVYAGGWPGSGNDYY